MRPHAAHTTVRRTTVNAWEGRWPQCPFASRNRIRFNATEPAGPPVPAANSYPTPLCSTFVHLL